MSSFEQDWKTPEMLKAEVSKPGGAAKKLNRELPIYGIPFKTAAQVEAERLEMIQRALDAAAAEKTDDCEFCYGKKGGVRGNENVVNGAVVCDDCSVLLRRELEKAAAEAVERAAQMADPVDDVLAATIRALAPKDSTPSTAGIAARTTVEVPTAGSEQSGFMAPIAGGGQPFGDCMEPPKQAEQPLQQSERGYPRACAGAEEAIVESIQRATHRRAEQPGHEFVQTYERRGPLQIGGSGQFNVPSPSGFCAKCGLPKSAHRRAEEKR